MMRQVITVLYFMLPAYAANMTPVVASRMHVVFRLHRPIDGGVKLFGEYLFGSNKTWRGAAVGIASAMFIAYLQFFLWQVQLFRAYTYVDFNSTDPLLFGFVGGIGALGGDLIKSFIKRRFRIKSGQPWPVFDQLDFVAGYLLATSMLVSMQLSLVILSLVLTLILHPLTNLAAFLFRIKGVWW